MRSAQLPLCLALAGLVFAAPPREARAWTEARPGDSSTDVEVHGDGTALVTQRVRWRVLGGRLREFEFAELPQDLAVVEASATVASGSPVPITVRTPTPGRLSVSLGEANGGLPRGSVDVVLRYTTSLRAQGAVHVAGGDAVLELHACPWERGMEAAEFRVTLPTGTRRARWILDDAERVDATVSTELTHDVLRALRRHVPTGMAWTVRVGADPAIFPWLGTSTFRRAPAPVRRSGWPELGIVYALGLAAILVLGGRAVRALEGAPAVSLPAALRPLPFVLAAAAAALHGAAVEGATGALSLGTATLLGAVALRLPHPGPGVEGSESLGVRVARGLGLAVCGALYAFGTHGGPAVATVAALDVATLLVASAALPALRGSSRAVSAAAAAAGGTSAARRRSSSAPSGSPRA